MILTQNFVSDHIQKSPGGQRVGVAKMIYGIISEVFIR